MVSVCWAQWMMPTPPPHPPGLSPTSKADSDFAVPVLHFHVAIAVVEHSMTRALFGSQPRSCLASPSALSPAPGAWPGCAPALAHHSCISQLLHTAVFEWSTLLQLHRTHHFHELMLARTPTTVFRVQGSGTYLASSATPNPGAPLAITYQAEDT